MKSVFAMQPSGWTNRSARAPRSASFPSSIQAMTIDDAYAVQKAWVALKTSAGRVVKGHKIGLTSKAMQYSSNINEPDYGVAARRHVLRRWLQHSHRALYRSSLGSGAGVRSRQAAPGSELHHLRCAERHRIRHAAVEIIDARIQQVDPETKATRKVFDTISDNAAGAALVAGGRPFRPLDTDLRWVSAVCYRNGVIEESGVAAAVLNHPANGVAWLANKFAAHNVSSCGGRTDPGWIVHAAGARAARRHLPHRLRPVRLHLVSLRVSHMEIKTNTFKAALKSGERATDRFVARA